ncbi:MAG: FAD-dependent monooxygenase [Rhodospirillaceae bacterium]|nr:FAD-dependent monooxygenase [Rhodospirillaceae bacterium]
MTDQVIIAGAGMVGLSLAIGLAKHQIPVSIIDEQPDHRMQRDFSVDNRCSAVTAGSAVVLKQFGVWDEVVRQAQPIGEIRVSDQAGKPGQNPAFFCILRPMICQPKLYLLSNRWDIWWKIRFYITLYLKK